MCLKPSFPFCKMGILIVVVYLPGLYGRLENVCKTPRVEPGDSKQSLNLHPILFPPRKPTFSSFIFLVLCYSLFQLLPALLPQPCSFSYTLACLIYFSRHSFTAPFSPTFFWHSPNLSSIWTWMTLGNGGLERENMMGLLQSLAFDTNFYSWITTAGGAVRGGPIPESSCLGSHATSTLR